MLDAELSELVKIKLKFISLKFFPKKGLFLANFCPKTNFSCHFIAPWKLSRVLLKAVFLACRLHSIIGSNHDHRSYHNSSSLSVRWYSNMYIRLYDCFQHFCFELISGLKGWVVVAKPVLHTQNKHKRFLCIDRNFGHALNHNHLR